MNYPLGLYFLDPFNNSLEGKGPISRATFKRRVVSKILSSRLNRLLLCSVFQIQIFEFYLRYKKYDAMHPSFKVEIYIYIHTQSVASWYFNNSLVSLVESEYVIDSIDSDICKITVFYFIRDLVPVICFEQYDGISIANKK